MLVEGHLPETTPWIDCSGDSSGLCVRGCSIFSELPATYAVRLADLSRGVVISDLEVNTLGSPDSPHITIDSACQATVVGGLVRHSPGADAQLVVRDQSSKSVLVGTMWRTRFPRLTDEEIQGLANVLPGDMVWRISPDGAGVPMGFDGASWTAFVRQRTVDLTGQTSSIPLTLLTSGLPGLHRATSYVMNEDSDELSVEIWVRYWDERNNQRDVLVCASRLEAFPGVCAIGTVSFFAGPQGIQYYVNVLDGAGPYTLRMRLEAL